MNRFEKYYGVEYDMFSSFDLTIDTSYASIDEVVKTILCAFEKRRQKLPFNKIRLSTQRIFPLENISVINSAEAKIINENIKIDGFNEDYPVSLLKLSNHFFIYDGHKRFSASLYNRLPLIPVEIVAGEKEEISKGLTVEKFVFDRFKLSTVHDWEEVHAFRYFEYPTL
jgi:hypothetical protein